MIHTTDGGAILSLIEKVLRRPEDYRRIVISSPFVDEFGFKLLERLTRDLERFPHTRLDLVVSRPVEDLLRNRVAETRRVRIRVRDGLHAKVYALIGMNPVANDGLITSANLTEAGITRNLEVGVRLRGANSRVARAIERAAQQVSYGPRRKK